MDRMLTVTQTVALSLHWMCPEYRGKAESLQRVERVDCEHLQRDICVFPAQRDRLCLDD